MEKKRADETAKEAVEKKTTQKPAKAVAPEEVKELTRPQAGKVPEFLKPYVKAYPKEKAFLVTSDRQVFLKSAANMAALHQKSLKDNGKVETINI